MFTLGREFWDTPSIPLWEGDLVWLEAIMSAHQLQYLWQDEGDCFKPLRELLHHGLYDQPTGYLSWGFQHCLKYSAALGSRLWNLWRQTAAQVSLYPCWSYPSTDIDFPRWIGMRQRLTGWMRLWRRGYWSSMNGRVVIGRTSMSCWRRGGAFALNW